MLLLMPTTQLLLFKQEKEGRRLTIVDWVMKGLTVSTKELIRVWQLTRLILISAVALGVS